MDFVSKFVPAAGTGHQQCLVLVDKFSRFVFLKGVRWKFRLNVLRNCFVNVSYRSLGFPRRSFLTGALSSQLSFGGSSWLCWGQNARWLLRIIRSLTDRQSA